MAGRWGPFGSGRPMDEVGEFVVIGADPANPKKKEENDIMNGRETAPFPSFALKQMYRDRQCLPRPNHIVAVANQPEI